MSIHNLGFCGELRKKVNTFCLKKVPYLELCFRYVAQHFLQYRLSSRPYFSLLFSCAPTFPYFFSENTLLSQLISPKMFEGTKICNFFPRSLCSLRVCKNQINLILAAMMQKFIRYSYFSCNSFLEHLFWYFLSMVM